jgi:hypothetical protein
VTITFTDLATNRTTPGDHVETITTDSFNPATGSTVIIGVCALNFFFTDAHDFTIIDGGGLTFTRVEAPVGAAFGAGGTNLASSLAVFVAEDITSPGATTVEIDAWDDPELGDYAVTVIQAVGTEGAVTVVQSDSLVQEKALGDTETITSPTLAALGADTAGLAIFYNANDGNPVAAPAVPATWTQVSALTTGNLALLAVSKAAAATSITCTDLGTDVATAGVAILELQEGGEVEPEPTELAMYVGELPVVALYVGEASA